MPGGLEPGNPTQQCSWGSRCCNIQFIQVVILCLLVDQLSWLLVALHRIWRSFCLRVAEGQQIFIGQPIVTGRGQGLDHIIILFEIRLPWSGGSMLLRQRGAPQHDRAHKVLRAHAYAGPCLLRICLSMLICAAWIDSCECSTVFIHAASGESSNDQRCRWSAMTAGRSNTTGCN